ncbi:MAG: hypothetical protein C0596_04625 [Marinilabiliales bacterium]|nr:MAG: hypothetical protein C0596_04625 [Marinilabiliales bacterium]
MKRIVKLIFVLGVVLSISACEKSPGEGGNATIVGSVWVEDYNSTFTDLLGEYAAMEEDVYIVYGDNVGYDDKTETDYLGNYRFNYLRPGKYTIFVYSKDSTMSTINGETVVLKEVEITESNQVLTVPQIIIFK